VIALDTNILVHARREEAEFHIEARDLLLDLAEGERPWALAWPCVYEFLRVVTHPKIFNPPTRLEIALEDLDSLLDSPSLVMLGQGPDHRDCLLYMMRGGRAVGNLAHDAHIAALALEHGVEVLWTTDRDFAGFPGIRAQNPFKR
jgi:toxin-antitoxin system PIN domain toxin